jgi:uncharacterized delta-60 repeat protein
LLNVEMLEDRSLLSVGTLDPLFDASGLGPALGNNAQANAIAVLRDNVDTTADPILIAGHANGLVNQDFFVARVDSTGALDRSFGVNGIAYADFGLNDDANSLGVRNNLVVVAGTTGVNGSRDLALARFNANGTLDTRFHGTGKLTLDLGGDDVLSAITVLSDNSIIAVGTTTGPGGHDIFVARISATGVNLGVTRIDINGGDDQANALTVGTDGSIYVAGATTVAHANGTNRDFALVKLTPAGTLDTSFGTGGITTLDFGGSLPAVVSGDPVANPSYDDVANAIELEGNQIVLAGRANNGRFDFLALARFNANGSLDTTFGAGQTSFGPAGTVTTAAGPASDVALALTVQPDGELVVAGRSLVDEIHLDQYNIVEARYLANGTLDTTFGTDGRIITAAPTGSSEARAIDFDDNGTLVFAGDIRSGGASNAFVLRQSADIRPIPQPNSFTIAGTGFSDPVNIVPLDNDFDPNPNAKLKITQLRVHEDSGDVIITPGSPVALPEGVLFTDGTLIKFTPAPGFSGTFRFFYTESDGWLSAETNIDVNVSVGTAELAGTRDPNFGGANNRVVTQLNFSASSGTAAATLGSDTVVAGSVVTRLPDGTTRTDVGLAIYDSTGKLIASNVMDLGLGVGNLNETVSSVVIQNVGGQDRIIVVGSVDRNSNIPNSSTANDFFAVRFMADATLDTSFGLNGVATVDLGGDDQALAVLVEPVAGQNDIVIGGITDNVNTPGGQDFALVRLNEDGTRDMTFGASGVTLTDFRQVDVLRALALQGTKIIAVGSADFLGTDPNNGRDMAIARYDSNGNIDTNFGNNGEVIQNFSLRDEALSVVVDPTTQDIIVGGYVSPTGTSGANRDIAIVRFTPDGSLETTWGTGGLTMIDFAGQRDEVHGLVIQGGQIFAAGIASIPNPNSITPVESADYGLAILSLANGSVLDRTATDFVGRFDQAMAIVPNGTGGVIAVGNAFDGENVQGIGLVSYDNQGNIDPTFGGPIPGFGEVFAAPGNPALASQANAVVVQSDGKIIAAGVSSQSNKDFTLVRYNPDGSIDHTYGNNGTVTIDVSAAIGGSGDDQINHLVLAYGDQLYAAGTATLNGRKVFVVARFNTDGSLDHSFGTNGIALADFGSDASGLSMTTDNLGNIILSGYATQNGRHVVALAEFDQAGNLVGLGGTGKMTLDLGVNSEARSVVIQDGMIAIAGVAGADVLLARFHSDGTLDTTFNAAGPMKGVEIVDVAGGADGANQLAVDENDKLVIAGFATIETGDTAFLAGRFNPDGTPDTSFGRLGTGLEIIREFGPGNDQAYGLTLQSLDFGEGGNVDYVLVGNVNFSGQSAFGLARLNQNGLLDTTFGTNGLIRTFLTAGPASAYAVAKGSMSSNLFVAGSAVTTTGGPTRFAVFSYLGQASGEFPPLTVNNTATTAENMPVTIPVLRDDQDPNGHTLSIVGAITHTGGNLFGQISSDGTNLTYNPPANQTGTETFTFMVTDGVDTVPSSVTITVVPPPDITAALGAQGIQIDSLKFLNLGGPMADGVFTRPINGVDPGPNGFVQLTTGDVRVVGNGTLSGVDNGNALGGNQTGAFDATTVEVDLTVTAANANFLSLDFAFLTNEFPIDPARNSNDAFVAELYDLSTAPSAPSWTINPVDGAVIDPNNFAYDATSPDQLPVSVHSHFFNDSRVETLTGTLYNAGTPFLRAGQAVLPGHTYRLFLSIFDGGDGQVDSAVFLHNLQAIHVTADPATIKGAAEGPVAGDDFLALPNPQIGVPVNVPVLNNDLSFDGGPLQIIAVTGGGTFSGGTPTITSPTTLSYTPSPFFSGSDTFTYTVMDSRGLTSTATVTVYSLVNTVSSSAAAPSQQTPFQSTNFVSQGQFFKNAPGSSPSVFTLSDYKQNPTNVPFPGTTFFDVYAPNSRASDRVDLYVNDPTGKGELFYFNGQSWEPVRSSGDKPPERVNGQLHFVLDGFSFPRVNFLFGTVFDVPVSNTTTTTTTVSNSTASTTGQGATTTTVTLNSDVQLSIGLSSSQTSVVGGAESSASLRQSTTTSSDTAGSASTGRGTAVSGSANPADIDMGLDVLWISELNPEMGELVMDQIQIDGRVDTDLLNKVMKPLPPLDSFDFKTVPVPVPVPGTAPEEEQQETEALDWYFEIRAGSVSDDLLSDADRAESISDGQKAVADASGSLASSSDELPAWAWAALAVAPLVAPRNRRHSRVTVTSISSSSR